VPSGYSAVNSRGKKPATTIKRAKTYRAASTKYWGMARAQLYGGAWRSRCSPKRTPRGFRSMFWSNGSVGSGTCACAAPRPKPRRRPWRCLTWPLSTRDGSPVPGVGQVRRGQRLKRRADCHSPLPRRRTARLRGRYQRRGGARRRRRRFRWRRPRPPGGRTRCGPKPGR
jgi:hypothetical protein